MYTLIENLKKESAKCDRAKRLLLEGRRHMRIRRASSDKILFSLWEKFNEKKINTSQLLRKARAYVMV